MFLPLRILISGYVCKIFRTDTFVVFFIYLGTIVCYLLQVLRCFLFDNIRVRSNSSYIRPDVSTAV